MYMLNFCLLTAKRHILAGTALFDVLRVKIGSGAQAVGCRKNPGEKKKPSKHFDAQFRAYGEKKPLEGLRLNFARR